MDGVQSFGEKQAFQRILGRLCRSGHRSSNEKSLLLLGSIASEFARRIGGLGQAGGGCSLLRTNLAGIALLYAEKYQIPHRESGSQEILAHFRGFKGKCQLIYVF